MIDGYRPVVTGYVPVELVMILKVANAVAHVVNDFDSASGVHSIRDQYLQISQTMSDAGFILQLLTCGIGDSDDINQQCVIGATGTRIFDRNKAMDAMPFADENQGQALADSS